MKKVYSYRLLRIGHLVKKEGRNFGKRKVITVLFFFKVPPPKFTLIEKYRGRKEKKIYMHKKYLCLIKIFLLL